MADIIVAPLQMLEEEGREAFFRAIDAAAQEGDEGHTFEPGAPISPVVTKFLEGHKTSISAFNEGAFAQHGAGLLYIQDRLDEPPVTSVFEHWINPYPFREIGGYAVIFLKRQVIAGLPSERAALSLIDQYASARAAVVHCRVAHELDPDRLDRPFLCVVKGEEPQPQPKVSRGKRNE